MSDDPALMRLSKRMSELGLASRREADEWIERGLVRVDGVIVNTLGAKVLPTQVITVESAAKTEQSQRVTILLHKPLGYVSGQAEDGYTPASALVQASSRWSGDTEKTRYTPLHARGLAPAGRLDIDSTGLLVLTQDGRIAKQLIGEDTDVEKEYLVKVYGALPAKELALLNHGLSLDGEALKPAKVAWANSEQLRFILKEGKKRQIRRMCEAVGLRVVALKRTRIGRISLGPMPMGAWRYLRRNETF
jgi:23S rRNA pseudouridine2604 synthase